MKKRILLSPSSMSGHEQQFIAGAFKGNWITPNGPNIDGFESDLETYLGDGNNVTALNSGTGALHLALILLGVQNGDEVICQSKTFVASANPILYQGATPIFVDSEKDTWNICPDLLHKAIKDRISKGKKPKAIIAVHLYGMPYKNDEISQLAKMYDIPVIEDSAEALGSQYHDNKCGSLGDISILSFNGNKIITTSGGGALVTKTRLLKEKAMYLATQSKEKETINYLHKNLGYNYRLSNVLAGIGRGQMMVLEDYVNKRRMNFEHYKSLLKDYDDIKFLEEPIGHKSNRWLTCVLAPSFELRETLRFALEEENIESRPFWKPMHQQPLYRKFPVYLNGVSDDLHNRGLCLPSGTNLSEENLDRITNCLKSCFVT